MILINKDCRKMCLRATERQFPQIYNDGNGDNDESDEGEMMMMILKQMAISYLLSLILTAKYYKTHLN